MSLFPNSERPLSSLEKVGMEQFPDPFCDMASTFMPTSMHDVLRWAEFVWINQGTYSAAMKRVVAYFLTEVELYDAPEELKDDYLRYMNNDLNIMQQLRILGLDFLCYGNSFSSLYIPFHRFLICPKCKLEQPIAQLDGKYRFEQFKFYSTCGNPKCRFTGEFKHQDRKSTDEKRVRIIRWSPHQIRMQFHPFSHDCEYLWKIPAELCNHIRKGTPFYLNNTPWEVIEAIKTNSLFRFAPNVIYHMKEETLAGIENKGWGIPQSLSNFKQAWYVQVLKRYNEAIALDYIIPFRVITPVAGNSRAADPFIHGNMGTFSAAVQGMLARRRRDPATWNVLPFPVDYRALGGEGVQLAPVDLLNQGNEELLNAAGVPVDFFRGTLQQQAAPIALRLFQQTWPHFVAACNGWINWLLDSMQATFQWEKVKGRLRPVTLADDLDRKQVLLQLAAGRQISLGTAMGAWGLNLRDEIKEIYNEQRLLADEEQRFALEQQKAQELQSQLSATGQVGAPPGQPMGGGGMMMGPMPGGQNSAAGGVTVMDLIGRAEQTAQQLIGMPYEARRQQLLNIKKSDPTLHALVKSELENMRQQGASQGRMIVSQQGVPPMGYDVMPNMPSVAHTV